MEASLTKKEKKIIEALVKAHNRFCELECYHPDDAGEWATHIHALQEKIMSRVATRFNPELFGRKDVPRRPDTIFDCVLE